MVFIKTLLSNNLLFRRDCALDLRFHSQWTCIRLSHVQSFMHILIGIDLILSDLKFNYLFIFTLVKLVIQVFIFTYVMWKVIQDSLLIFNIVSITFHWIPYQSIQFYDLSFIIINIIFLFIDHFIKVLKKIIKLLQYILI